MVTWVARDLLWGNCQDVGWGCSYWKTWQGRGSTSKLAHSQGRQGNAEGFRKAPCLGTWPDSAAQDCSSALPQGSCLLPDCMAQEKARWKYLYDLPPRSRAVSSTISLLASQVVSIQCGKKLHRDEHLLVEGIGDLPVDYKAKDPQSLKLDSL